MILRKSLPHPPGIDQVRIKVVGVGGGGVNAVRRMSSLTFRAWNCSASTPTLWRSIAPTAFLPWLSAAS